MSNTNTNAATKNAKPARQIVPLNGVDTPTLFATIGAVKEQPELAEFQFRATNQWQRGTHSKTTFESFSGAGGEHEHPRTYQSEADHPEVLVGGGNAPTPVEYLLHALASCLTAGIGNIAAARGIVLDSVESRIEGDINLLGLLGLSKEVRNGYQNVRISFSIKGNATEEQLEEVIAQSRRRSAVYDVLTNGIPVEIEVNTSR